MTTPTYAHRLIWLALAALMVGCPSEVPEGSEFADVPKTDAVTGDGAGLDAATADVPKGDASPVDASTADSGTTDAGPMDSGSTDAGPLDSGTTDAGPTDTGPIDSGTTDTGAIDSGPTDAGTTDAGPADSGITDAGPTDTGVTDAGPADTNVTDAGPADTDVTDVTDAGPADTSTTDAGPPSCPSNVCDDGNPCTKDICTSSACAHIWLNDATPCGGGATCLAGHCHVAKGWASALAAGYQGACAVDKNKTRCWGTNYKGELGGGPNAPYAGINEPLLQPNGPAASTTYVTVSRYQQHTCRIAHQASGATAVECWGDAYWGQIGPAAVGSTTAKNPVNLGFKGDAVSVCTGERHSCVVGKKGSVWCVGHNGSGQLGVPTTTPKTTTLTQVQGVDDALSVACGALHTCARRAGGTVWCWGDDAEGQLGQGPLKPKKNPQATQVAGLKNIYQLGLGEKFSCARSATKVWCWGNNANGQLGLGSTTAVATPTLVTGASGKWMSAGEAHVCLATAAGKVQCWGRNSSQESAPKSATVGTKVLSPVLRTDLVGVTRVAAGHGHTCALLGDGSARCWGSGSGGGLGDGSGKSSATPLVVKGSQP